MTNKLFLAILICFLLAGIFKGNVFACCSCGGDSVVCSDSCCSNSSNPPPSDDPNVIGTIGSGCGCVAPNGGCVSCGGGGADKGNSYYPYLDNFQNQAYGDGNNKFIPHWWWDGSKITLYPNEDKAYDIDNFRFSGSFSYAIFGSTSTFDHDNQKTYCYDDSLGSKSSSMNDGYSYSCSGSSCGMKMSCKNLWHILSIPQQYLDAGYKWPDFYTIPGGIDLKVQRTNSDDSCPAADVWLNQFFPNIGSYNGSDCDSLPQTVYANFTAIRDTNMRVTWPHSSWGPHTESEDEYKLWYRPKQSEDDGHLCQLKTICSSSSTGKEISYIPNNYPACDSDKPRNACPADCTQGTATCYCQKEEPVCTKILGSHDKDHNGTVYPGFDSGYTSIKLKTDYPVTIGDYEIVFWANVTAGNCATRDYLVVKGNDDPCPWESIDVENHKLISAYGNADVTGLDIYLPEYTTYDHALLDMGQLNSNYVSWSLNWIFQPNFTSTHTVVLRLAHRNSSSSPQLFVRNSLTDSWTEKDAGVVVGEYNGSKSCHFEVNKTKQYKFVWSGGTHVGYHDDQAGSFFVGTGGLDRPSGNKQLDAFLSYFIENEATVLFAPLINSTPEIGSITGQVYLDDSNQCNSTTVPDLSGWNAYVKSTADNDQYTLCTKSGSSYICSNLNQGNSYIIKIETVAGTYIMNSCSSSTQVVPLNSDSVTANPFYVWPGGDAWFQTDSGDVASGGRILDKYPAGKYFTLSTVGSSPGVVVYKDDSSFGVNGNSPVSAVTDWQAKTPISPKGVSFASLKSLAGDPTTDNFATTGKLSDLSGSDNDVYYRIPTDETDDLILNDPDTIPSGKKLIVFVEGNVTINQNITVTSGGFLAIIASGDITVADNVTQLEGVYVTDKTFTIQTTATPPDVQFVGNGIFVADRFALQRDLGEDDDAIPAEKFIFRPDLVLNAPQTIWQSNQSWQEVAP